MNILKGLGKLIFSLDLKVNYHFFCLQKDCNNTKLGVVVDEVFLFIYECNLLVPCFTDRIAVFWMKRGLFL